MLFSLSFYIHFILSFVGFLFLGIYLCRGSWRNVVRAPLALGITIIAGSHLGAPKSWILIVVYAAIFGGFFIRASMQIRSNSFTPSVVREGHNVFSLLVGAALFALTVQLHSALFGVPVFQLVK